MVYVYSYFMCATSTVETSALGTGNDMSQPRLTVQNGIPNAEGLIKHTRYYGFIA